MKSAGEMTNHRPWPSRLPFYYGWINVLVAAVAMTATLPGRTHGLGLVTEPLLADLQVDRVTFAHINLIASLIGAAFCLPVGWMIDRWGVRMALATVTAALGVSVLAMGEATGWMSLLATLILVRGFGQSALSVVSMAAIGKWFSRRLGLAMGAFAVLLTFGFIASVLGMGEAVKEHGWRPAWQGVGYMLLAIVPLFWLFARSTPESCGVAPDAPDVPTSPAEHGAADFTFGQALATPAFWVLVLGSSVFNLVWSGVTLFNESMLAERDLDQKIAVEIMAILTGIGLLANLVGGALASRTRVVKLLGIGLVLLAGALAMFPTIATPAGARVYAALIGLSGGLVTVVFFAAFGHLFGRARLGGIQGAAQFATVLASALGPELMAESQALTGSYAPMFFVLAAVTGGLALLALVVPLPRTPAAGTASAEVPEQKAVGSMS
ncbi:MAG TPA: MFS transporter [Pirellulales bacterium]|nr:MFS transporter [Pirellulales bacterium]